MSKKTSHKILEIISTLNLSEKTIQSYARHIGSFLSFSRYDDDPSLLDDWKNGCLKGSVFVSRADLQSYVNHMENEGRSASTVAAHIAAITAFCEAIGAQEPSKVRHTMPQKVLTPKGLERTERLKLLREVEKTGNKRNTAIIYLLLYTGLRVSELCALDVADIQIADRSGSVYVRHGKGNKERSVPMPHEARQAIKDYLNDLPHEGAQPLFMTNRGTRVSTRSVQGLCADLGTNPHALRHTFCRMLVAAGVDIVTVAALAGHANLQSTAIYAQPTERELSDAISKAFSE